MQKMRDPKTKQGRSKRWSLQSGKHIMSKSFAFELVKRLPICFFFNFQYLDFFLKDNPGESCASAGHAAYSDGVRLKAIVRFYF